MRNCSECNKIDVCPKAKHIENYFVDGCSEFFSLEDFITEIFSKIEVAMDNRSTCTHTLSSGSVQPCCVYESELFDDIEHIKNEYLGVWHA